MNYLKTMMMIVLLNIEHVLIDEQIMFLIIPSNNKLTLHEFDKQQRSVGYCY